MNCYLDDSLQSLRSRKADLASVSTHVSGPAILCSDLYVWLDALEDLVKVDEGWSNDDFHVLRDIGVIEVAHKLLDGLHGPCRVFF